MLVRSAMHINHESRWSSFAMIYAHDEDRTDGLSFGHLPRLDKKYVAECKQKYICDDDGNELPVGSIGAIFFSDGRKFSYHNDLESTRKAYNRHGWSTIGDIGRVDEDGFLYLSDRKSFVIISGGVNIYPQEAENILIAHDHVMDVAVFGVPNEEFGEEVKGVVQLKDHSEANPLLEAQLIDYCRERLSHVKCPRTIDFREELPRHPTGKLYKRLLKDEYWKRVSLLGP